MNAHLAPDSPRHGALPRLPFRTEVFIPPAAAHSWLSPRIGPSAEVGCFCQSCTSSQRQPTSSDWSVKEVQRPSPLPPCWDTSEKPSGSRAPSGSTQAFAVTSSQHSLSLCSVLSAFPGVSFPRALLSKPLACRCLRVCFSRDLA